MTAQLTVDGAFRCFEDLNFGSGVRNVENVNIVGAGINGLMTAYMLASLDPNVRLTIVEAGKRPVESGGGWEGGLHCATFGSSRNARQFSGTEGLSFQTEMHSNLIQANPDKSRGVVGWQTIPEHDLTKKELHWRQECITRYTNDVAMMSSNIYDMMYTEMNFAALELWKVVTGLNPALLDFKISSGPIHVLFATEDELEADYLVESNFDSISNNNNGFAARVRYQDLTCLGENLEKFFNVPAVYGTCLQVPGEAWRIQSVAGWLIEELEKNPRVTFRWNSAIRTVAELPSADHTVWAASNLGILDIYQEQSRVQELGGFWLTMENQLFKTPFKIKALQPSGYVNCTPDGNLLHISGGFGWVGERVGYVAEDFLEPTKQYFLEHVSSFFKIPKKEWEKMSVTTCVRPCTPTGLPDVKILEYKDRTHTMISGSGKAGAMHAPLLALFVAKTIGLDTQVENFLDIGKAGSQTSASREIIERGLLSIIKLAGGVR